MVGVNLESFFITPIVFYGFFLLLCLIPSLVFGVVFQLLISKLKIRKYTIVIMTFLSLPIGVFISYFILPGIGISGGLFYIVMTTIGLSTLIVCYLRKYLLDRRNVYVYSAIEIVYTVLFAVFITPIVMTLIFSALFMVVSYAITISVI